MHFDSVSLHCEHIWPVRIPVFQRPLTVPLHNPHGRQIACHEGCARRLWKSLSPPWRKSVMGPVMGEAWSDKIRNERAATSSFWFHWQAGIWCQTHTSKCHRPRLGVRFFTYWCWACNEVSIIIMPQTWTRSQQFSIDIFWQCVYVFLMIHWKKCVKYQMTYKGLKGSPLLKSNFD